MTRILLYTQPGCLSCELMKVFLEAQNISFEEFDTLADTAARTQLLEKYGSNTTPTVVVLTTGGTEEKTEVITGFDPERLDQALSAA